MNLEDLEPGAEYSFKRHDNTFKGVYVEWFWEAEDIRRFGILAENIGTRRSRINRITGQEVIEIQVANPKGGAPLGYTVALEDLTNG